MILGSWHSTEVKRNWTIVRIDDYNDVVGEIITADEAYKAQNGSYTDTAGLVTAGLLKSTPTGYTINSSGTVTAVSGNANGCT